MPCDLGFKGDKVPTLDDESIDGQVEKERKGVYGLDRGSGEELFKVYYVGRADGAA